MVKRQSNPVLAMKKSMSQLERE
jgi:hypothetical protein